MVTMFLEIKEMMTEEFFQAEPGISSRTSERWKSNTAELPCLQRSAV